MKILPAGLPPLPSGLVYLGLGGSFKEPRNRLWSGFVFPSYDSGWTPSPCGDTHTCPCKHFAAPTDSEIIKLNTPPALDLSKLPIGTRLRRRDGVVGVLKSRTNALYYLGYPDYLAVDNTDHYVDGKRCSFKTSTDDIVEILHDEAPSELEALKARVAVLEKELADGKAKTCAAAPAKWKPAYHNRFSYAFNTRSGESKVVMERWHSERAREAGLYFKSKRASDSAADYRIFFSRLLNLAAELNPSGLVGGRYRVSSKLGGGWYHAISPILVDGRDFWDIFETEEAAKKAAEILNRDGWKVPSLPAK